MTHEINDSTDVHADNAADVDLETSGLTASPTTVLTVGDTVWVRGNFGTDAPHRDVVLGLQVTRGRREKYGRAVDAVSWDRVRNNYVVVDLESGHWAYGEQVTPDTTGGTQ